MPTRGALHLPTCPLHGSDDLLGFLGAPAFRSCLLLQRHTSYLSVPRAHSRSSSWTAHPPLATLHATVQRPQSDTEVQRARPVDLRARSGLGPCCNGPAGQQRSPTVTNGSEEPQVIAPPAQ